MLYLFLNCNLVPDRYDDWKEAFVDLADYVWKNEPMTMTYYMGIPLDYAETISKTTSMLAFEAYETREHLYQTHLNSAAMSLCLSKTSDIMSTGIDISHYTAITGFLSLSGDKRECQVMQDTRIVCFSPSKRALVLLKLKAIAELVEMEEKEQSKGVLTYMVFESLDDETGLRIFGRFADRPRMEEFLRRKEVVEFWLRSKDEVKSMECRGYVPSGNGWLCR